MAEDGGKRDDGVKKRLQKQRNLKSDLSGALMAGRIAARTETRVKVAKAEVDAEEPTVTAAAIPTPPPNRAAPPTAARRPPPTRGPNPPPARRPAPPAKTKPKAGPGQKRVAWDPKRLTQFITGVITLAELEGISKEEQYEMAALGHTNLQAGKFDAARKVFEGLAVLDPRDAYFHLALGSIAQQQERLDDAEKSYTKSLQINPYSPHALANRGEVRMLRGAMVEGAKDLLRALEEDPKAEHEATRRARATISVVLEQLGDRMNEKPEKKAPPRARGRGPRPRGRPGAPRRSAGPRRASPRGPRRPTRPKK